MREMLAKRWLRRLWRDENGGTLAELAILVPFLIVMLAAVTELGRFFQTYTTLSKSTRAASRYLSNQAYEGPEGQSSNRARNIAYCGKLDCAGTDPVVKNLEPENVVIEVVYPPTEGGGETGIPETVKVSIQNFTFQPLFDVGALLNSETFSLALPVRPSTTMHYMWTEPAGAEE